MARGLLEGIVHAVSWQGPGLGLGARPGADLFVAHGFAISRIMKRRERSCPERAPARGPAPRVLVCPPHVDVVLRTRIPHHRGRSTPLLRPPHDVPDRRLRVRRAELRPLRVVQTGPRDQGILVIPARVLESRGGFQTTLRGRSARCAAGRDVTDAMPSVANRFTRAWHPSTAREPTPLFLLQFIDPA